MRILVAIDESRDSRIALTLAIKFAVANSGEGGYVKLFLCNVQQPDSTSSVLRPVLTKKHSKRTATRDKLFESNSVLEKAV